MSSSSGYIQFMIVFVILGIVKQVVSSSLPKCLSGSPMADVCTVKTDLGDIDLRAVDGGLYPRFNESEKQGLWNYAYLYNPCTPFTFSVHDARITECSNVLVCGNFTDDSQFPPHVFHYNLGDSSHVSCQNDVVYGVNLIYGSTKNTSGYHSKVHLKCDESSEGNLKAITTVNNETEEFEFVLATKHACFPGESDGGGGLSVGSILCIILLVVVVVYLVVGTIYNYATTAETGSNLFPHASFWNALPGLVADGVRFAVCAAKPKTYEEI